MMRLAFLLLRLLGATGLHAQLPSFHPPSNLVKSLPQTHTTAAKAAGSGAFVRTLGDTSAHIRITTLVPKADGTGFYFGGTRDNDALIGEMNTEGALVWVRELNVTPAAPQQISELIVDSEGMLGGAGHYTTGNDTRPFVFRYDLASGAPLWITRWDDPHRVYGLMEEFGGGDYLVYSTATGPQLDQDAELMGLDRATGALSTDVQFHYSVGQGGEEFTGMVAVQGGMVASGYVVLETGPGFVQSLSMLSILDSLGNAQAALVGPLGGTDSVTSFQGRDLVIDADGLVHTFSGRFNAVTPHAVFLQKVVTTDSIAWTWAYDLDEYTDEVAEELLSVPDGYVLVGYERGGAGHAFILKTNKDGELQWSKRLEYGAATTMWSYAQNQVISVNDSIYFTAYTEGAGQDESVIVKLPLDGSTVNCPYLVPTTVQTASGIVEQFLVQLTAENPNHNAALLAFGPTDSDLAGTTLCSGIDPCDTLPPTPVLKLGPDTTLCVAGQQLLLDAGPGFVSYLWQDSTTAQTFLTPAAGGTFYVTTIDSCGNVQSDTITVTPGTIAAPQLPDTTTCLGASLIYSVTGFDSIQWVGPPGVVECDTCTSTTITPTATTVITFTGVGANGCVYVDSFTITVVPFLSSTTTLTACAGDTIVFGGVAYTQNITLTDTLTTAIGCDSLANTELVFTPLPTQSFTFNACVGDSITVGGVTYTADTTFVVVLPAATGCDTVVTYAITFTVQPTINDSLTSCANEPIVIGGVSYSADTTVTVSLPVPGGGCDTLATYVLTFTPLPTTFDTLTACAGEEIVIDSVAYTADTTVVTTIGAATGCDTVATYVLTFTPLPTTFDTLTACAGEEIVIDSVAYTADTTLVTTIAATTGCDTVATTVLIFTPLPTTFDTLTACAGEEIVIDSVAYTADTTIVTTIAATTGCDTVATTVLIFTPLPTTFDTLTACAGEEIVIDSVAYTADTTIVTTIAATTGCDTVATTVLTFTPQPTTFDTLTACAGREIEVDSVTYTTDTVLVTTIPATTGCDTVATTVLIFTPPVVTTETLTACEGDTILFGGVVYTQNTTLNDTLTTAAGCDSILTTVLTFTPLPTQTLTFTACAGDSIVIDSVTYTADTSFVVTVAATTGCDTLVTYEVTFTPQPTITDSLTSCANEPIVIGGVSYTADTTVTTTLPVPGGGCDTLATYVLTFTPLPTTFDTLTACAGDTIVLDSVAYTADTTLVTTIPATTGCDTAANTVLIFTPLPSITTTLTACAGDTIVVDSVAYTADTTLVAILPATTGCDTMVNTVLVFTPLPSITTTLTACAGDTIVVDSVAYTADTTLVAILPATTGCDTTVNTVLVFTPLPTFTDTIEVAAGDTIFIGGVGYTAPATVTDTLPSTTGGCDTVATYVLVLPPAGLTLVCPTDTTIVTTGDSVVFSYAFPAVATTCANDSTFNIVVTSGPASGGLFALGTTQVCFQVTNECGDTATCCFNVTVQADTTNQTTINLQCPGSITVQASGDSATVIYNLPTATTNCGPDSTVTIVRTDGPASGAQFSIGTTLVCFRATNACGDTAYCCVEVTVVSPAILLQCPGNITVETQIDQAVVTFPNPTASTTCTPDSTITFAVTDGLPSGSSFPLGTTLVCFRATNVCGDTAYCCLNVNVVPDTTAGPTSVTLTCPANISVNTPGTSAPVTFNPATATTDCTTGTLTVTQTSGPASGSVFGSGTTTICYLATNGCGDAATCCFTVTVNEPPCDTKIVGCMRYDLLSITETASGDKTYRVRVTNNCNDPLKFQYFQVPSGTFAVAPANNSLYVAPTSNREYRVRNPNFAPFYSLRFLAQGNQGIVNGQSDIFEFTLDEVTSPNVLLFATRLQGGSYYEATINTTDCQPPQLVGNESALIINTGDDSDDNAAVLGTNNRSVTTFGLFPNPTTGTLQLDLSAWTGQTVTLQVFNAQGARVEQTTVAAAGRPHQLVLNGDLGSGMYYIVLQTEAGERATARFVLQRM